MYIRIIHKTSIYNSALRIMSDIYGHKSRYINQKVRIMENKNTDVLKDVTYVHIFYLNLSK